MGFELVVITLWLMDGVLGKAVPQPSARWKLKFNTVGGKGFTETRYNRLKLWE